MAAVGTITNVAETVSIALMGYQGLPPLTEQRLVRKERNGVAGQDYIYGAEHGVVGTMRIAIDSTTDAGRTTALNTLLALRGYITKMTLGGTAFNGWMLLNVVGAPEFHNMAVAVGGVASGKFVQWVTIQLEYVGY